MTIPINLINTNTYNASTSQSMSASGKPADKKDTVFGLPGALSKKIIEKIGEHEPLAVFAEVSGQKIMIRDECNEIMLTLSWDQLGQPSPDVLRLKAKKLETAINNALPAKYKNNICKRFQDSLGKLNLPGLTEDIPGNLIDDPNLRNDGGEGGAKVNLAELLVTFVNLKTQAKLSDRDKIKVTTALGLYQEILKWPNIRKNYPRLYVEANLGLAEIYSQIEEFYDFEKAKAICGELIQDIISKDKLPLLSEKDRKELDARAQLALAGSLGAELNEQDKVPSPEEYQKIFDSLAVAEDEFNQLRSDNTEGMVKLSLERANALFQIGAIYKEMEDAPAANDPLSKAETEYKRVLGYKLNYLWPYDNNRYKTASYLGQAKVKVSQTDQMIDESLVLDVLSQTLKDLQEKTGLSLDNLPPSVQAEVYMVRGQNKVERFSILRDQGKTDLDLLNDAMKDLEFVANNGKRRIAAQANLWLGKAYIAAAGAKEKIWVTEDKLKTAISYIDAAINTSGLRGSLKLDADLTQAETLIQLASIANITGEKTVNKAMLEKAEKTLTEITKCGNKGLTGRAYIGLVRKLLLEVSLSRYVDAKSKLETAISYVDKAKKYIPASARAAARRKEELDLVSGEVLARYWLTLKKKANILETGPDYVAARKALETSVNCMRYSIKIDACLLLADLCSAGKEYGEAEKYYGEALSLVKDYTLSAKAELTAKIYNGLGKIYAALWEGRDYKKAGDYYALALTETTKISSPNQDKEKINADAYIGLGEIYSRLWESRDKKQAESYCEKAKSSIENISEEDPRKAQLLAEARLGIANLKAGQMDPVQAYADSIDIYTLYTYTKLEDSKVANSKTKVPKIVNTKEFEELDNDTQARIYLGKANLEALNTDPEQALKSAEPYYEAAFKMPGVELQTITWIKLGWANLQSRQIKLPDQIGFIYNEKTAKPVSDLYKDIMKYYSQDPYAAFLASFGSAEFLATVQKYPEAISLCRSILAEKSEILSALNKSEKRLAILKTRLLLGKVFSWAGEYLSANAEYKEFESFFKSDISDPTEEEKEIQLDAHLERAQYLAINKDYSKALEMCQTILTKVKEDLAGNVLSSQEGERIISKVTNMSGRIYQLGGDYNDAETVFKENLDKLIKTATSSLTKNYDPRNYDRNYLDALVWRRDAQVGNGLLFNNLDIKGSLRKNTYSSGSNETFSAYGDLQLCNIPISNLLRKDILGNDHLGIFLTGGYSRTDDSNPANSTIENTRGWSLRYQAGKEMKILGLSVGHNWGINGSKTDQYIVGGSFDNKDEIQISGTYTDKPFYLNMLLMARFGNILNPLPFASLMDKIHIPILPIHIPAQFQLYGGVNFISGMPDPAAQKDAYLSLFAKLVGTFPLGNTFWNFGLPHSLTVSVQAGNKLRAVDNQGYTLEGHITYALSDYLAVDYQSILSTGPGYFTREGTIWLNAHINFWDTFAPVRPGKAIGARTHGR